MLVALEGRSVHTLEEPIVNNTTKPDCDEEQGEGKTRVDRALNGSEHFLESGGPWCHTRRRSFDPDAPEQSDYYCTR